MSSNPNPLDAVRGLFFDVFGTVVDWRKTVTDYLNKRAQQTLYLADECSMPQAVREKADSMSIDDWGKFADDWRKMYFAFTRSVAAAAAEGDFKESYKNIDTFQLESLQELLQKWNLRGLWNEEAVHEVSRIWHYLDPWQDSVEGIKALNAKGYQTSTLSNGNVDLLTDMAKYAGLEWKHIISSEMFKSYKPNPEVYKGAARKLSLKEEECAMVATHLGDLNAARKCGFRTIYVERQREEMWEPESIDEAKEWVDIWVKLDENGFVTVAERLPGVTK